MSDSPSTDPSTSSGRDSIDDSIRGKDGKGRFAKGNRLGRGNPLAGRAAKIRAMLLRKLTPERTEKIAEQLIAKAETGDLAYIRELLDRTIGKAQQEVTQHIDSQISLTTEAQREAENARLLAEMRAALAPRSN